MSIINLINNFKKRNRTLFTTPSHGQGSFVSPFSRKITGKSFFKSDFSEIDGFDNLANPTGYIKLAQDEVSRVYDSKASFFLVNGSTSGIVASMLALLNRGDKVLVARNCHKSVYNGLVLTGAVPVWLMPCYNQEWGIYEPINCDYLEEVFQKNKDIKLFIMTNPTYEGLMSDVYSISYICKKYNVKLLVDEAHGALWHFYKSLGTPSLMQGADVVVQSLHKTAGALNPSALLHISKDSDLNPKKFQDSLNLITTTSPSYPILANIEGTVSFLNTEKGTAEIADLVKNINRFIRALKEVPNIDVYVGNNDVTKILVKITNLSGVELSNILSEKYNIEDELANEKSVLFITGLGTTKSKLKRLERALTKIALENIIILNENKDNSSFFSVEPRVRYTPAMVWNKLSKEVELKYAISRVCMEMIVDYPPGIPILLPGEVIKKEHINYLQGRKKIRVLM